MNSLPAGSSLFVRLLHQPPDSHDRFVNLLLQALLDTCDSGTHQLDLSHYHCNSMYVPWRSNGKRRAQSWQNVTGAFTIFYPVRSHETHESFRSLSQCVGTRRVRLRLLAETLHVLNAVFFPCQSFRTTLFPHKKRLRLRHLYCGRPSRTYSHGVFQARHPKCAPYCPSTTINGHGRRTTAVISSVRAARPAFPLTHSPILLTQNRIGYLLRTMSS